MGVGIVQMIAAFLFLTFFTLAANNVTDRLRHAYLSSVIHQDARFFENVGPGEAATRLTKDIGVVRTAVGEKLGFIVWSLSTLITALVMGFTRAPRLAGVLLAIIPTGMIAFTIVSIAGEKVGSRSVEVEGKASTFLEQIVGSIRIVQAFAADKVLVAKYDTYLKRLQKDGTKKAFVKGGELAVTFATLYLVYSTSFWFGSQEVTYRGLEVKSFFTCFWNFFNALYSIANILPHITSIIESTQVQGRLRVEINRIPEIDVRNQGGLKFASSNEWEPEIELDNISFAYPSRPSILSLDRVSMVVPAGKVTAIVGVSQEPQLFTASIFENVAYGLTGTEWEYRPETDDEKRVEHIRGLVKSALESAQAWDFVSKLPQGMDTKVSGARTGVLSGGQRQRIAAARALIRHPRILILDEGTSALDAEVEARLMRSVHAEQKLHKMTTILIAHRLSTIQQADNIIVMSQGRVVEEGTYNQLIVAGGVFANLVAHQLSGLGSDEPAPDPKEKFDNSDLLVERPLLDDAADKMTVAGIGARRMLQRQSTRGSESKVNVAEEDNTKTGHGEDSSIRAGFLTSRYIGYLKGPSVWFVLGSAVTIVLGVSFPIAAFLIGKVVKTFALPDGAQLRREAYEWSLWFLVISIVNIVFCLFSGFFLEAAAERLLRAFRINSLRAVLQQEVAWFDQERNASGTLTALIATYASNASSIIGLTWSQILACFVNVIGAVILGLILSWKLSLVGLLPLPFIQGHIVFKNCTMQYAGRYTPALKDVSFEIKPGQTVAFCGPSGGGKSTVLALINRFYDPSLGTIEVDGIDIRAMPLSDYRSTLALVSQDAILYDGTIRENITLGYDGVSQEDLEAACQDARILEFIQGLPDGFETNIGLKGAQMSGGQRQRMCIARALLRKPKILLLDEATSALDAESEKGVQEALDAASQGRTTICVAHRLSTIQNADVIYVIEDGQVVEFGNHSELVKKNGRYYDLVKTQL
ncbi:hypothetical protein FRC03_000112 [Tulasnella sp. 419]|nr:hypothetical protein FRC03_000112 [Tulasnella sp. 419]